ncbi:hypothetical protein D3C72_1867400 [compost metagenome]
MACSLPRTVREEGMRNLALNWIESGGKHAQIRASVYHRCQICAFGLPLVRSSPTRLGTRTSTTGSLERACNVSCLAQ